MIAAYKVAASTHLGGACRFHPSCSDYAQEALQTHSVWKAIPLIIFRLGRCRPGGNWGADPVPATNRGDFHARI